MLWQVLSALLLLTMGGIHLYLVLTGFGGLLGVLFVLNAIGGVVLAIAMIAAHAGSCLWRACLACCSWRAHCSRWCSR